MQIVEAQKYNFPLYIYFDNCFFTISKLPRLVGPTGLTFYTICYIAILYLVYFLALIISCKSGLIWPLNWFVKLNGNSVLIPGIYLGEIKGKNLARLAHFLVVVEYFYQDPLAQENQQPLQFICHDIK